MWTLIFIILALALFFIPILPSIIEWKNKTDAKPITVRNEYDTDITYFAQGFRQFIINNMSDVFSAAAFVEGKLDSNDYFQFTGNRTEPQLNNAEESKKATRRLFASSGDINLQPNFFYEREVYSAGSIN